MDLGLKPKYTAEWQLSHWSEFTQRVVHLSFA